MLRRRTFQTLLVVIILLGAIIATLAAADLWGIPARRCSWQVPKVIGCLLSTHGDLAGGLIAGGGTILAGWIAWIAVQAQIISDRALATARERETLAAILSEMRQLIDAFNEVWRAIDYALLRDQPVEVQATRVAIAQAVIPALPQAPSIEELKTLTSEMAKEIAPAKRGQFLWMLKAIDWIYGAIAHAEAQEDDRQDPRHRLSLIRIHLSHFERYLSIFDATTARIFTDREKVAVDHRGIGAQIKPMVDKAERGEPLIGPDVRE